MSPDWWRDCRDGIEKCSSPTGDGNPINDMHGDISFFIEKCSSPTGDGNPTSKSRRTTATEILRNVVPRQGTETLIFIIIQFMYI